MIHIDRHQHHTFDRGSQTCHQIQTIYMIRFRYATTGHWLCKYLYINTDKKVNSQDLQKNVPNHIYDLFFNVTLNRNNL